MRIGNDTAFVEFEKEDNQFLEDISYRIRVARDGFIGEATGVYFSREQAREFIVELEALEQNQLERAELENLSSGSDASPLDLEVRRIDPLGHLVVGAKVRKLVLTPHDTNILSTEVYFELDREFLTVTILNFKKLFSRD